MLACEGASGADMLSDEALIVLINESVNAGRSARRKAAVILIEALRARDGHVAVPPDQAYEVLHELRSLIDEYGAPASRH